MPSTELESAAALANERWFFGRPFGPTKESYKFDQPPQRSLLLETEPGRAHRFRGTVSPPNCAVPRCTALDGFVHPGDTSHPIRYGYERYSGISPA